MHIASLRKVALAALFVSPSLAQSIPDPTIILDAVRTVNMLANIPGFGLLPDIDEVLRNATLNVGDIQSDVLIGMNKKIVYYYFFQINATSVPSFKLKLRTDVVKRITSTQQILKTSTQPITALNLAFSQSGITTLGQITSVGDAVFGAGQAVDANNLGDPGTTNWVPAFKTGKIDGVFLIASDQQNYVDAMISLLESLFKTDIIKLYGLQGGIRLPPYQGHEMFGYLDGISQPAVAGFTLHPLPGQATVAPGVILAGGLGDTVNRPTWTKDGSFLAFRQLQQLVPEFDTFLKAKAPPLAGKTQAQSADLLGARLVGRWKSGAPVDLSPLEDNPALGADPNQNNNFDYLHLLSLSIPTSDQSHCPFSAHIRKTRPRSDLPGPLSMNNHIVRAGIPYGPEVSASETSTSTQERGLAFVAYQSNLANGFQFLQTAWANTANFPPLKNETVGFDPIIGANQGKPRESFGPFIQDASLPLTLDKDFVVSRGGEYFFSPSISAIRNILAV